MLDHLRAAQGDSRVIRSSFDRVDRGRYGLGTEPGSRIFGDRESLIAPQAANYRPYIGTTRWRVGRRQ